MEEAELIQRKDKKIKLGITCTIAAAFISALSTGYSLMMLNQSLNAIDGLPDKTSLFTQSQFMGGLIYPAAMIFGALWSAKQIRAGSAIGWVVALSVCIFCLPGYAFPASVLGIFSLLDTDIRSEFLSKLDIKI
jgi:hypothetical protein